MLSGLLIVASLNALLAPPRVLLPRLYTAPVVRWLLPANTVGITFARAGRRVGRLDARMDVHISRNDQYAALTLSQFGSFEASAALRVGIRMADMIQVLPRTQVSYNYGKTMEQDGPFRQR